MNTGLVDFSQMAIINKLNNSLIAVVNMIKGGNVGMDDFMCDPNGKWPYVGKEGFFYVHDALHNVRDATLEEVEYAQSGLLYDTSPNLTMVNFGLLELYVFENWSVSRIAQEKDMTKETVLVRLGWVTYAMDSILHAKSFERTWRGFSRQCPEGTSDRDFFRKHKQVFKVYFELAKSYHFSELVLLAMRAAENMPEWPVNDQDGPVANEIVQLGKQIKASGNDVDFNAVFEQLTTI